MRLIGLAATVAACDIYNKGDVEGMLAYRLDLNDISSNSWGVDSCSMKQDNFTGTVTTDPWTNVVYTATTAGTTLGTLTVNTGATETQVSGRALIIHNRAGIPVACALLQPPAGRRLQQMPDPWAYLGYAADAKGVAKINARVRGVSLVGGMPVLGRAVVFHDAGGARVGWGGGWQGVTSGLGPPQGQ